MTMTHDSNPHASSVANPDTTTSEPTETFDPSRWQTIKPTSYEYLPFSAGPRTCIGYRYAMHAIRVVLCMVLRRFGPELVPGTRIDPQVKVTMSSKQGMPMVLRERGEPGDATPVSGRIRELVDL